MTVGMAVASYRVDAHRPAERVQGRMRLLATINLRNITGVEKAHINP